MSTHPNQPHLEPPGKGLPPLEAFLARHILFPVSTASMSRPKAIQMVEDLGQKALHQAQMLSDEQCRLPQLIQRFPGIEDSSRHWSILMTIQHLWITGESMASITERLATSQSIETVVRIEDVKPNQDQSAAHIFSGYKAFLTDYSARMACIKAGNFQSTRHSHPWFGPINGHQWLCLNAMHHRIHLTQIHRILALLESS